MAPTPDPPKPRKQRGEPQSSILTDAKALAEEVELLEAQINVLRARYEQFFLGMDKRPPVQEHDQFKRRMLPLRQPVVRNSAMGFRIQTLQEKVAIYERMWSRTLQEMENGTYRRDLFKARRRRSGPEIPAAKAPAPAAQPEAQAAPPAASRPSPTGAEPVIHIAGARATEKLDPLSEARLRGVYQAYVEAKKQCNEDTTKLSFDQVASSLRKQVPELLVRHRAQDVEYRVFIKDGRAVLRAVPKSS
jgi:hypothetical protein